MEKKAAIFSRLESAARSAKASSVDSAERKLLEREMVFGSLIEELLPPEIESAYSDIKLSEAEEDPAEAAKIAADAVRKQAEEARERSQLASIQKQIDTLHRRTSQQVSRLEDRKDVIKMQESSQREAAVSLFFSGRDGGILNYLVNGELAMIDPELKELAKKMKSDPAISQMVAKVKAQLTSEEPNMDLLKVIKYKISSRMDMLESMEKTREEK